MKQRIIFICGKLLLIGMICSVFGMCRYSVPMNKAWSASYLSEHVHTKGFHK